MALELRKISQWALPKHHEIPLGSQTTDAERSGNGYEPLYLKEGYKTLDVIFEVKEKQVDIGNGYQYRALTFDGNFPAKTISVGKNTLVRIQLKNSHKSPHSLHTHVIKYKPESDGTLASATIPGQTRYYFWEVTLDTPSGFYPFHDHGGESSLNRGLMGTVEDLEEGSKSFPFDPKALSSNSLKRTLSWSFLKENWLGIFFWEQVKTKKLSSWWFS